MAFAAGVLRAGRVLLGDDPQVKWRACSGLPGWSEGTEAVLLSMLEMVHQRLWQQACPDLFPVVVVRCCLALRLQSGCGCLAGSGELKRDCTA